MTTEYTTNRLYPKPDFNTRTWHDQMHQSLDMIDADMGARDAFEAFIVTETWTNGEDYLIDDLIVDSDDLSLWKALVAHTSGATGTFAADRTLHPTYWQSSGVQFRVRGAWAAATAYQVLDHVYDTSEGISAICSVAHTSTTGIRADAANWVFLIDLNVALGNATFGQLILASQVFGH